MWRLPLGSAGVFISAWILTILSGGWDAERERDSRERQCRGTWAPSSTHIIVVKAADTSGPGAGDEASTSGTARPSDSKRRRPRGRPQKRRKPPASASSRGLHGLEVKRQRRRRQRQSASAQAAADGGQASPLPSPGWAELQFQVSPYSEPGDGGTTSESAGATSTQQSGEQLPASSPLAAGQKQRGSQIDLPPPGTAAVTGTLEKP